LREGPGYGSIGIRRITVSDAVTLARTARESLARGLTALQGDPNVPPQLLEVAAPIAQAMGALHQIERSGGAQLTPGAQNALTHVQTALGQLQAIPTQHPAVVAAMEAVAGALGTVHALTRAAAQPAAAPPPQPAAAYAQTAYAPAPAYAPPPQQAYAPPPQAHPQPAYAQQPPPAAAPARAAPAGAPAGAPVSAELGAHSTSNFYKGLSGNDIIDHGGLFVSTYKLPKIGQPVRLKVSMPGGYEFEANAIVRWCREASEAGNDAPPGFGAQFVDITPEARQLVYRYVRNREPMFHDDL
jgi:Tfp pilus assembly protein PilZ